jgi:hypothetical protein
MNNPWSIRNFDKIFDSYKEIKIEKVKEINIPDEKSDAEIKSEIKELHLKGWSYAKIAEKLGTTKSAVSGIVYRDKLNKRKYKGKYD